MVLSWIKNKIIGSKNQREINRITPFVEEVNQLEEKLQTLSEEELKAKTSEFKERIKNGETLDQIKAEAFAVVKNACRRLCGQKWIVCDHELEWNMVPYDVQIIGGLALHEGRIAEMATGEGKTLVASFPLYLNALTGRNVQLVTVNEYLARRDSEWVGRVFEFLGLSVGSINNAMGHDEKVEKYNCDITYGTASEFGFDYLRDNGMSFTREHQVQKDHYYCIIDEVDSVLVDEARTPLIISGPVDTENAVHFKQLRSHVQDLVRKQMNLVTESINQAQKLLEEDIRDEKGAELLYSVGIGFPKNRKFKKMMELPKFKRVFEETSSFFNTDLKKRENQEIKESLFYVIEEKNNQVSLTEKGRLEVSSDDDPHEFEIPDLVQFYQDIEADESLSDSDKAEKKEQIQKVYDEKLDRIHCLSQLLKAYSIFEKDIEYVVQDQKVMIVDENTGRLQAGRRFSDGLHQALEAKENVPIEKETQTLASITIQNYFRMYDKLAGMTGTAETEADEFFQTYKMEVLVIPTNKPITRDDMNDVIYKTKREKYNAVIDDVIEKYEQGRPVLVGTASVEASEVLSRFMKRRKVPHNVLNAKNHQNEADIVAQAGQAGRITIATNMAGRGTDIKLGEGVLEKGGLHIIGSERHDSRRIDRQLRGRAGRQGDSGSSIFFISLEDDLMRLFGSDRMVGIMEKLGMEEGQDLQHPFLNRAIERAQKKVEERNFSIRKHTLKFDDVMNQQRTIFYENRNHILSDESLKPFVLRNIEDLIDEDIETIPNNDEGEFSKDILLSKLQEIWPMLPWTEDEIKDIDDGKSAGKYALKKVRECYELKEKFEGENSLRDMEKYICLQIHDQLWKEHLREMDGIREDAHLKSFGQRDPLQEYKKAGYLAFEDLMYRIRLDIASKIFAYTSIQPHETEHVEEEKLSFKHEVNEGFDSSDVSINQNADESSSVPKKPYVNPEKDVGRNDPCPCGSGKKYKKCCGQ